MAMLWSKEELSTLLKRAISADVTEVSIDSRKCGPGHLFIGLSGENFNGGDFAAQALSNGASLAVVDHRARATEDSRIIRVDDTLEFLNSMAQFARNRSAAKIIGVTGSVGKTTTKEMLKATFGEFASVYASVGNFNNHFGMPLCLANMPRDVQFAIIEMGMSGPGEIARLTHICKPDLAIITTVAAVHLEFFPNVAGIAHAKSEIFEGVPSGGYALINYDNEYRQIMQQHALKYNLQIFGFGRALDSDARLLEYHLTDDGGLVKANIMGQNIEYQLGINGEHHAVASLAVLLSCKLLAKQLPVKALASFGAVKGRGQLIKAANGSVIIDESYNASPTSVKAALKVLKDIKAERKIVILADMKELGESSAQQHQSLLQDIIESGADRVFLVGEQMLHLWQVLPDSIRASHEMAQSDIYQSVASEIKSGDAVLIKGSNSMGLGDLVERLQGEA